MEMNALTIPRQIQDSVNRFGHRIALVNPSGMSGYKQHWTYQEMFDEATHIAQRLILQGILVGERIGLLSEGQAAWPICDIAIQCIGAISVPVYPSLPANQVAHIVRHSGMKGIFVQNHAQLAKLLVEADTLPDLAFVVVMETVKASDVLGNREGVSGDHPADASIGKEGLPPRFSQFLFAEWNESPITAPCQEAVQARMKAGNATDVATIVYTSGTTGVPKGVCLTHQNLLENIVGIQEIAPLSEVDKTLSYLPLSHIFERTAGQYDALVHGATICYSRGFQYIAEDFVSTRPTVLTTVPRLLDKIQEQVMQTMAKAPKWRYRLFQRALAAGSAARVGAVELVSDGSHAGGGAVSPASLPLRLRLYDRLVLRKIRAVFGGNLRMIVSGGAPLSVSTASFFAAVGLTIVEGYGMTETSPVVAVNSPSAPRIGWVGKILSNVEACIADDGELWVRGPSICQGYYHDEQATRDTMTDDGWLKTGDIGEIADGYLRITDRKKNLIVLSTGKKVTPAPIEAALTDNPYIDQALLLGQGQKYVTAIVVPNTDALTAWRIANGRSTPLLDNEEDDVTNAFLLKQTQLATMACAHFEQPKKILVIHTPFTIENGLLTPTLKVRGKAVATHYAGRIEKMYTEAVSSDATGIKPAGFGHESGSQVGNTGATTDTTH